MTNVFYADKNDSMPIIGAGVIFYRYNNNNKMELLLNKNDNAKYEDLGGYFPLNINISSDLNYFDIVLHTIAKITNDVIIPDIVLSSNSRNYCIYNNRLQYLIILIKSNQYIKEVKSEHISNKEIEWVSLYRFSSKNILKHSVNSRISSKEVLFKIKEIEYMHRLRLITKKYNYSPSTSDDFSTDSNESLN